MVTKINNPWENVSLNDYEAHMSLPDVKQLQILNDIMKKQIYDYKAKTIAILGVAGGNGLEHIDCRKIETVYGIDINQNYLDACKNRYSNLKDCLILLNLDISDLNQKLPQADLIIANLFVEYVGIAIFTKQVSKVYPAYLSCIIQKNLNYSFVSDSPYTESFAGISELHRDVEKNDIMEAMAEIGYTLIFSEEYLLPNKKEFIRLDFKRHKKL